MPGLPRRGHGVVALFDADGYSAPRRRCADRQPSRHGDLLGGRQRRYSSRTRPRRSPPTPPSRAAGSRLWTSSAAPTAATHDFSPLTGRRKRCAKRACGYFPAQRHLLTSSPSTSPPRPTEPSSSSRCRRRTPWRSLTSPRRASPRSGRWVSAIIQLPGFEIDASDRDDAIAIRTGPSSACGWPTRLLRSRWRGQTYYATVNEGDDRGENARVEDLALDPTPFLTPRRCRRGSLGRLTVSTIDGDTDGDGDYDRSRLWQLGHSRSTRRTERWCSIPARRSSRRSPTCAPPHAFNNEDYRPGDGPLRTRIADTRSDNKGPEPEALAVGKVDGALYAFVGLEATMASWCSASMTRRPRTRGIYREPAGRRCRSRDDPLHRRR